MVMTLRRVHLSRQESLIVFLKYSIIVNNRGLLPEGQKLHHEHSHDPGAAPASAPALPYRKIALKKTCSS